MAGQINKVHECVGEKKTLFTNILSIKAKWIEHIIRRNYLLHDSIEEQMGELKEEVP